jgi:hypothetical protein
MHLQRWTAIALLRMAPTLVGGIQNRLAVGDDLKSEAKWIEDRSQRQFYLAQKGIVDGRPVCFLVQGFRRPPVSLRVGRSFWLQLSEQRWIAAKSARCGEIYQFVVHG